MWLECMSCMGERNEQICTYVFAFLYDMYCDMRIMAIHQKNMMVRCWDFSLFCRFPTKWSNHFYISILSYIAMLAQSSILFIFNNVKFDIVSFKDIIVINVIICCVDTWWCCHVFMIHQRLRCVHYVCLFIQGHVLFHF